ncbi:MAG TPA: S-layer homology domain-containing protein, partial [Chloroflexia bacterium]|nr:S-layer homology domain-containing protein [Chloroflexia bacterium]
MTKQIGLLAAVVVLAALAGAGLARAAAPAPAGRPAAPAVPVATATPCPITFSDVQASDYFYTPVLYLACGGVVSGYGDGTFRPYNPTTRSQLVKIVVLGFAIPLAPPPAGGYTFADVPPTHPFYSVVETAAAHQIVSGYACGGPGEVCDSQNRP